jgi:peptidyl-prolyl cis-trans isomerase C
MRQRLFAAMAMTAALGACGGETIATVGSHRVSKQEFEAYLKLKNLDKADPQRRDAVLGQYLEREALAQAIEKSGKLDEALIDAELREYEKEMLISRYFEKHLKEAISDDAIKSHYAANAQQFEEKRAHVAHILVRANPGMTETERQARLTKAREAHAKVTAGTDFAKVAADYSEDTISSKKGGDLGWLKEGSIDPEFSKRMLEMKEGEISEPFMTPFGFHVMKLLEGPSVVKRPLEEVEGDLRYRLRTESKDLEVKRLMSTVSIQRKG